MTKQDLEQPRRDEAVDRALQKRFFRNTGVGMSEWDARAYLRDRADMAAYLEAAAEEGESRLIAVAVADVMQAMTAQTTVEARGALANRAAFDAALEKVRDVSPDEGDAAPHRYVDPTPGGP